MKQMAAQERVPENRFTDFQPDNCYWSHSFDWSSQHDLSLREDTFAPSRLEDLKLPLTGKVSDWDWTCGEEVIAWVTFD